MTAELVQTTTELQLVEGLDHRVQNRRMLIAALHKIGAVCGASPHEVSQTISAIEGWQRADYTDGLRLPSRWSYKGRIAEQASLSQWHLPTYNSEKREQLPTWAQNLCFKAERHNGQIVLKDVQYEGVPYADFANALGIDPEPPAMGCLVRMTLPRVHEDWASFSFADRGMLLPLTPFMEVLGWFFKEPGVVMTEQERSQYAEEQDMALDESLLQPDQFGVATYANWLGSSSALGEYLIKRFTAEFTGEQIEFAEAHDGNVPGPERKHLRLQSDSFWADLQLVHSTEPGVVDSGCVPEMELADTLNGETGVHVMPSPVYNYWESEDDVWDAGVVQLTFGFAAALPYTLAQKRELQHFADEFAAKLREHFEPAMRALQSPRTEAY